MPALTTANMLATFIAKGIDTTEKLEAYLTPTILTKELAILKSGLTTFDAATQTAVIAREATRATKVSQINAKQAEIDALGV